MIGGAWRHRVAQIRSTTLYGPQSTGYDSPDRVVTRLCVRPCQACSVKEHLHDSEFSIYVTLLVSMKPERNLEITDDDITEYLS
jgi:hypothetical protein